MRRLSILIDNVLQLANSRAGTPHIKPTDVAELIRSIVREFEAGVAAPTSIPGRTMSNTARWSPPRAITAPSVARNVSRGTPSQSAQSVQMRVSSTSVSPTSKTTALTPIGCGPAS